tara:strand:+ start:355 stop:624 length:270 start_codon:yes stop_codon:yes gene_type:complete
MTPKDVWKRDIPSAVDDAADVMSGYERQLEIVFKPADATPKQQEEWQEKELHWWGERQLLIVAIAVVVQILALAFMGSVMLMNSYFFGD